MSQIPLRWLSAVVVSVVMLLTAAVGPIEASGHKWVEIDLSTQRLRAYENDQLIYDFVVSTGKRITPTVTGTFKPWIKLLYDDMQGGSRRRGDYYFLKNVPYVVYFHGGYGLHGTYWHNNFGRPMSHGCVNLRISDAAKIFPWIDMDTPIIISGATP